MLAGRLNRRVVLQERVAGQDSFGQPVNTWQDVATLFADIRYKSGLEAIRGDSLASIKQASIRIRYRQGVNAGMRFVYNLQPYRIVAVLPDASGRDYIDCACEVVND